jgi:hypothetical protein
MENVSRDFGTGLLDYVRRSARWDADRREPVRVAFASAIEDVEPKGVRALILVPLVAAFFAGLPG